MNRFAFEVALAADDHSLCELLRKTPMDGQMRIAFSREPSFFQAAEVEGDIHQTVVCRDQLSGGRIVAMGSLASERRWVDGALLDVGYLSGLRILPQFRSSSILARGYRKLRELHESNPLPVYLTTVAVGNDVAWRLLSSGRAGLPTYRPLCNYHTVAIPLHRRSQATGLPFRNGPISVQLATSQDVPSIIKFWNEQGSHKQFFPHYDANDLVSHVGKLRGFDICDLLVAWDREQIVGTMGVWDQTAFRRTIVHDYGATLGRLRPLVNFWACLRGRHGLPKRGEPLPLLFANTVVIQNDDLHYFRLLLDTWLKLKSGGSMSHLVVGLCDHDPLRKVLTHYSKTVYPARLCSVDWNSGPSSCNQFDNRPVYMEVGRL